MTKKQVVKKILECMVPRTWTKGTLARDKYGHPVYTTSKSAVRFCATGWMEKISLSLSKEIRNDFYNKYRNYISNVNDLEGYNVIKDKLENLYKE